MGKTSDSAYTSVFLSLPSLRSSRPKQARPVRVMYVHIHSLRTKLACLGREQKSISCKHYLGMPAQIAIVILLMMVALLVGGCDMASPAKQVGTAGTKPIIAVLLYKQDDVYISLVGKALEKSFADKASLTIFDARNDQFLQTEQFAGVLEKKVSALVVNIVDTQAASYLVDKAKKAGVPVVFFNREPDLRVLKAYDKACFVGTTAFDAGKMQGDLIQQLWVTHPEYDRNKDGKFQYVMLQGNPDNPEALARTEYSVKQAIKKGVSMQQVGQTYVCNWDEARAREAMRVAFATHGNAIELVIANSDAMALGAISVLSANGYNKEGGDPAKFIPVVGVDATPQAIAAIGKGVMSATVKQDSDAMAQAITALTLNAVAGKGFLAGTPWTWDESGIAVRIPYSPYTGK